MLLARVEDNLVEASPELKGICQHCGSGMIAKCGELRRYHWAHKSKRNCDEWQSGKETDWHYNWKKTIGLAFAEKKIIKDDKYHIADILIQGEGGKDNLIIEFQNSPISQEELMKREDFYGTGLIWVINGTALRDKFIIDKTFISYEYDNWWFFPKYDFYFLDKNPLIKQGAWIISIPQSKYSLEYEKFLLTEGFLKHNPTFQKIISTRDYYLERVYYKPLSESGFNECIEDINKYCKEFKLRSFSEFQRVVSRKNICKTKYVWKYSKQAFNSAKYPIFIDLNNEEIFQIKKGWVEGGCEGNLIRKDFFLARIRQRIMNASKEYSNKTI